MLLFLSVRCRASAMISAIASSTTLRVLQNGALKHGDARAGGGVQVDLVGADAERADRQQIGGLRNDPLGDLGARSDAQQADAVERVDQLVLAEGTSPVLDLEPALGEHADGLGMDVLQQQGFHVDPF